MKKKSDIRKYVRQRRKSNVTYFTLRIKGILYGVWHGYTSGWGTSPSTYEWLWEILDPMDLNTVVSASQHQDIVALVNLLQTSSGYAGLKPQEFAGKIVQGWKEIK